MSRDLHDVLVFERADECQEYASPRLDEMELRKKGE